MSAEAVEQSEAPAEQAGKNLALLLTLDSHRQQTCLLSLFTPQNNFILFGSSCSFVRANAGSWSMDQDAPEAVC